jgi:cytoskeletal protein RodZ
MRKRLLLLTVGIVVFVVGLQASAFASSPSREQYNPPTTSTTSTTTTTETTTTTTTATTEESGTTEEESGPFEPPTSPPGEVAGEGPSVPEAAGGSLPLTGFQAGLVLFAGAALVAAGFAIRRIARSHDAK